MKQKVLLASQDDTPPEAWTHSLKIKLELFLLTCFTGLFRWNTFMPPGKVSLHDGVDFYSQD